jgi:hypothetical protein
MKPEKKAYEMMIRVSGYDPKAHRWEDQPVKLREDWATVISDAIRAAVAEEREACAKVADAYKHEQGMLRHIAGEPAKTIWEVAIGSVAVAIRARA